MNKSIYESQNVNEIFSRIKQRYGLKHDAELAKLLGMNPNTLSMHRRRGKPDYERIISACSDSDLNWIFRGERISEEGVGYPMVDETAAQLKSELTLAISILNKVAERF